MSHLRFNLFVCRFLLNLVVVSDNVTLKKRKPMCCFCLIFLRFPWFSGRHRLFICLWLLMKWRPSRFLCPSPTLLHRNRRQRLGLELKSDALSTHSTLLFCRKKKAKVVKIKRKKMKWRRKPSSSWLARFFLIIIQLQLFFLSPFPTASWSSTLAVQIIGKHKKKTMEKDDLCDCLKASHCKLNNSMKKEVQQEYRLSSLGQLWNDCAEHNTLVFSLSLEFVCCLFLLRWLRWKLSGGVDILCELLLPDEFEINLGSGNWRQVRKESNMKGKLGQVWNTEDGSLSRSSTGVGVRLLASNERNDGAWWLAKERREYPGGRNG